MSDNDTSPAGSARDGATPGDRPDLAPDSTIDESDLSAEERQMVTSTRRFDLRRILGALFVVYGVIVFVVGLFTIGGDELKRTGGIAINLWTGGGMFLVGLLFFLWDRLSPVPVSDIVRSERLQQRENEQDAREGLVTED